MRAAAPKPPRHIDLDPQANSTMSVLDMPQVSRSVYDAIAQPDVSLADTILRSAAGGDDQRRT